MKQWPVFFLFLFSFTAFSQKELKNVFSYYSQIYGGAEDSGSMVTESYVFVANAKVELKGMAYQGAFIFLEKGDSLVINVSKNIPYNGVVADSADRYDAPADPPVKDRFRVMKDGRIYYANVQWPYQWPGTIEYSYKKKMYVSRIKEGFDKVYTDAAP